MFVLHPQLLQDTFPILSLPLSRLLLLNDARYPWVILVPARPDIVEITDLSEDDYALLTREVRALTGVLQRLFKADKMNVAALGNMVPQLHVHVIARYKGDAAWPGPTFGAGTARPYTSNAVEARIREIAAAYREGEKSAP
ncbi:HIT domain-containing protein [Sneathiella sp.]|uniref:HIT domain-containing protein n=1 Tax=Sneathiella sp. TaxID=1964365 RepID=UPI002FE27115